MGNTYDYNGNTLTKVIGSNTTSFAWDFENRLTSVTLPGSGGTVSFKYDPFGRRIQKSFTTGANPPTTTVTNYLYDRGNLIEEVDSSGNVLSRYSQGLNIDEPLAMLRNGATNYYQVDGLGSVTSLSNTVGAVTQTYAFDSFGRQTGSSGSVTNPFRYTAREFDSETNLYFYRARYYDPNSGRFLNEDPLIFEGGIDFYVYTLNNPVSMIDPLGETPCSIAVKCRGVKDWRLNTLKIISLGLASYEHCYIDTVDAGGKEHIISAGPVNHQMTSGVDDDVDRKEPHRKKDRNAPTTSCPNDSRDDCEKEQCMEGLGHAFENNFKDYDPRGKTAPNSNSAVDTITHSCGINVTFPKQAKGWDYFKKQGYPTWGP